MATQEVKQDLRTLYDNRAGIYGTRFGTPAGNYYLWRKINTALALAKFEKGSHILDVGCASGHYTLEFAKLGFRITGVDLSPECIKLAGERAKKAGIDNLELMVGDAEDLSMFQNDTFDGAISFSCLRYLPSPQKAINEMFRVVKRQKPVVVDFPNRRSPWFNYLKPWFTGSRHIHDHFYLTNEVVAFLGNAGFQGISATRILYTPKSTWPALLKIMKLVDVVGELPLLNQFAAIIMCAARKP
ncbi:MAG: class I SAM-dependent methyltransferase [Candidatus Eisenbacteria bacterium]